MVQTRVTKYLAHGQDCEDSLTKTKKGKGLTSKKSKTSSTNKEPKKGKAAKGVSKTALKGKKRQDDPVTTLTAPIECVNDNSLPELVSPVRSATPEFSPATPMPNNDPFLVNSIDLGLGVEIEDPDGRRD